jgi:drug/metabolite transporter (DMT)-like permease
MNNTFVVWFIFRKLMFNSNFNIFICVVLCLFTASVDPIGAKIGYKSLVTPYQLLVIKFLVGGIVIIPLIRRYRWIGFKNTLRIFWLGLLLAATSALIFIALKYLTAVVVITIITTTPVFVAVVNQMLGKELLGKNFWPGFFLCFIGILLSIEIHKAGSNPDVFNLTGLLSVFASVVTSTIYRTRMDDATKAFPPLQVSTYMFLMDGILALFFLPTIWPVSAKLWGLGIIVGIAATVANITFLWAIYLMGSTRISVILLLQRPIVIVCAALILRESLSFIQITGIILVMAGIQMAKVTKRTQLLKQNICC